MQRLTILNTQAHLCDAFRGPQRNSAPRAISKLNSLIPRRIFGRKRRELDSPNQGGHLPNHPTLLTHFPTSARKWAVVSKNNWTPYRAYLLSDLRMSPPIKGRKLSHTGLRRH
ncbi:hypothetical protein AVEN_111755-1 [Araneus ventricosus]|uniref:Uncharacterized protein n=1 Tax=Araneus ventricosus TaxID=182803 RepID=A0A4Y2ILU9_ARAVE|nr:hypothetical protein AVEN_111755-1 [Araneus ventricosus]